MNKHVERNAILFGNGFNLLSEGCPSWHELLVGISDKEKAPLLEGIPPTLQYEQVYLTPDSSFSNLSHTVVEGTLKEAVKRRLSKLPGNKYYDALREIDADIFLTTNYDHSFYENNKKAVIDFDASEKLYSVRRWKKLEIQGKELWLYFLHGDIKQ